MQSLLAIETSCDETSAAVIRDGEVASLVVASQVGHEDWGGVVPELASRAHLRAMAAVINKALADAGITPGQLNAVAVTSEPGLIGSLLVGVNTAKGMAAALCLPLIAVNHLEAHLYSILIDRPDPVWPYMGLVVSGGHTLLYLVSGIGRFELLGATRDDAAGEAFDKGAKLLGLGYPGGPLVDEHARSGNREAVRFPRALLNEPSDDFSFSGLKTSLRYHIRDHYAGVPPTGMALDDLCASYQEAIVDALAKKTIRAARRLNVPAVAVVGGVSVNSRLRERMAADCREAGMELYTVAPVHSTDNAAMIGIVGWHKFLKGETAPLTTVARASMVRSDRGRKHRKRDSESSNQARPVE